MPQVDFYILPDITLEQRALFSCRLIEKIHKLGHGVYLHTQDQPQAEALDELLWQFQASSFIPHEIGGEHTCPVQIGWRSVALEHSDTIAASTVLINLADVVPSFFNNFQRIAEIVVQLPAVLTSTRNAWRYYQQQGCVLERRDLRATQH